MKFTFKIILFTILFSVVFFNSIKAYLEEMSENGLHKSEHKIVSNKIEESISTLNATMFDMFKNQSAV